MKKHLLSAATSILGLALIQSPVANLQAAELNVLAGGAMTGSMQELGTQFERASGHKLAFRFGTTPELIKLALSGGPFDLGVVPVDVMKDTAARAKFAAEPTTDIARVGLGVAVRAGAPKPDISTPDALKQTLLKAQSIASILESATGYQLLRGEAMKATVKSQATPARLVQTVANGEVELGVFVTNVLTAPGLDLVGPFPAEVQRNVVFTSAVAADTKEPEAAKAFITFLQTPAATAVIKAKGMNPG